MFWDASFLFRAASWAGPIEREPLGDPSAAARGNAGGFRAAAGGTETPPLEDWVTSFGAALCLSREPLEEPAGSRFFPSEL